jgi:hypothetical protein
MPDGVGHGEDGEAEGESNAEETDAGRRERSSEQRGAATTEDEPERAEEFGDTALG